MLGDFLIMISGARQDILEGCKGERSKYQGLGGAILTTCVIAGCSLTFALASALKVPVPLALMGGILWALAILSLDRWLVNSLPAKGRRLRLVLPRLGLAILLGVVISTPFVLQIFNPEIQTRIAQIQEERTDDFLRAQQMGALGKQIAAQQQAVEALKEVRDSGGAKSLDSTKDPQIVALTAQRDGAQKQRDKLLQVWQCHRYGGPGCERKGNGPIAQSAEQDYRNAARRVTQLNDQIQQRQADLAATDRKGRAARYRQAVADLEPAQAQLDSLLRTRDRLRADFEARNNSDKGLLLRLKALDDVTKKNGSLQVARLVLFLLFLTIECLPVLFKLMQRPGLYDELVEAQDQEDKRRLMAVLRGRRASNGIGTADIWSGTTKPYTAPLAPVTEPTPAPGAAGEPAWSEADWNDAVLRTMHDPRATRRDGYGAELHIDDDR